METAWCKKNIDMVRSWDENEIALYMYKGCIIFKGFSKVKKERLEY